MKVLLIFDQLCSITRLRRELISLKPHSIFLLPLISRWKTIREIENICHLMTSAKVELINSAELIDQEVDALREKIAKWSSDLGNYHISGKSIIEWFMLPENQVSAWWFSLISEKNNFKTNNFFRIAQIQSIDRIIRSALFDKCIFTISERNLSIAIKAICRRHSIGMLVMPASKIKKSFTSGIKSYLKRKNIHNAIGKGLFCSLNCILKSTRAKLEMGKIKRRLKQVNSSVLFISYFPAIEKKAAEKGKLKNKYALSLQEKLSEMDKKVIWIWMYVFVDGHSYKDALRFAKKFTKSGEMNFFLDEFMSFSSLIRVLFLWLRQIHTFLKLRRLIPEQVLTENLSIPEGSVFIKDLMLESFVGGVGFEGIMYFELFKGVFSYFSNIGQCIYYSEMHAWEKALNAAKELKAPEMKSIGFQHGGISQNHFFYFHHPQEVGRRGDLGSLPLPSILACNGDVPLSFMQRCGYPKVQKVEAIRHLYLNDYLNNSDFTNKRNVILIAGSINKQETEALISLCYEVFSKPTGFQIWFKGHPSVPIEGIVKALGIDLRNRDYTIKHNPINELLKSAKVLIVGSSGVAIEALALGCRVINVVLSDNMTVSYLKGFEEHYTRIYTPEELKLSITSIMQSSGSIENFNTKKDFVSKFWCIDKSLKRWESLLR